ncbi:hypothetical protein VMCG_10860 [Cytospora schulzeri]|uniref:Uncharacterized protein n=1 Tax=Cytospora schulzeri TaxID=448051 RepID=A0A423V899_9PEZI|nr:hypothetical protein VMCG_10860 [Valsa malicola]
MASGWFGSRAIELVKARSLFIKVLPTPASLSERRAVLHALRRYGQIEIFKRLPNPETFICVPTKGDMASDLVSRSPLTFKFISETLDSIEAKSLPGISPAGVASPIHVHEESNNGRPPRPGVNNKAQSPDDMVKTFTMHINPSQSYYEHKTNIRLSPIHGPWPRTPEQDQDSVYFALREVVPSDMAREGLCDWHTGGQLSGEPASIRAQHANSKLWHIRERQMRKRKNQEVEESENGGALVAFKSLGRPVQPASRGRLDESAPEKENPEVMELRDHDQERAAVPPDPFAEMERLARGGDKRKPAPQPTLPALVRRKQVKLNPLADGRRYRMDKKVPVPGLKGSGKWYEYRQIYKGQSDSYRRQMDEVKLPIEHMDGKT